MVSCETYINYYPGSRIDKIQKAIATLESYIINFNKIGKKTPKKKLKFERLSNLLEQIKSQKRVYNLIHDPIFNNPIP